MRGMARPYRWRVLYFQLTEIYEETVLPAVAEITKKQPRGRPFKKGVSGNPGGRPKRTQEEVDLMEACKEKTPEALAVIVDIMQNGSNDRVKLQAAVFILERAWGKAPLHVAVEPVQVIPRNIDPYDAYMMMLDGGRLEDPSDEIETA